MAMNSITVTNMALTGTSDSSGTLGASAVHSLLDVSKQHLKAANALGAFDGVALPQLLNAALSMELYLKALAIHAGVIVSDRATFELESLTHALQRLPENIRNAVSAAFFRHHGVSLEEQFSKFSKAFSLIRHHHQMPDFYEGFDLHEFMQLARFLGEMELPAEAN